MASHGSLPLYYRNSKPTGIPGPTKTWKDNYLLLVVFVGFIVLIAGTFWFLPPLEEKDADYEKTYGRFTGNPASYITDLVIPSEPTLVPPEASEKDERGGREKEGNGVGVGVDEDRQPHRVSEREDDGRNKVEIERNDRKPVHLEDLIGDERREKEVEMFNKHRSDPPRVETSPPAETSPPDTENPPEGNEKEVAAPAAANEAEHVATPTDEASERVQDIVAEERRRKIVEMAKHAWDGYVEYAWGENELKPISRRGHLAVVFGKTTLGATIVDSLDTLYLMGLQDRFDQGKEWVRLSLNIDQVKSDISVFEFNIRFVGGLLSAYALSGDKLLKDRAVEIADKLMPAFNTPTGIPKSLLNLGNGKIKNWGWASGGSSILAEFGSLHLEFQYLTHLTGDRKYLDKVEHIRRHLKDIAKPGGLYPNFLNPNTGNWGTKHISVGALGDSFYEYLLKSWLMTSKEDVLARDMYYEAMDAIDQNLVKKTSNGMMYITDMKNGRTDGRMQHLTCFAGGMFALGATHATNGRSEHHMDIARGVADMCHESYQRTATKLGPEAFRVDSSGRLTSKSNEKMYLLRPETVETYFYLWRITHDQKYRDWGWEVVESLEKNCRIESGGYTGVKDVYSDKVPTDDVQQSFFIAETLKYLYLLFSDDSVLPLDSWVLNTEAHPFPVLKGIPNPAPSNNQS
jgi:mannosyl-oligosaccharide alpha-1,2-mannosidase